MALITRAQLPRERNDTIGEALRGLALGQGVAASILQGRELEQRQQQQQQQAAKTQQIDELARLAVGGEATPLQELAIQAPEVAKSIRDLQEFQRRVSTEEDSKAIKSMVEGAALALNSPNPLRALEQRKDRLSRMGVDTTETQKAIDVFISEGDEAGKALLSGVTKTGQQLGLIKPLEDRSLDIEQQKIDIRREERKERALDRALNREKNELEREKLQIQLDETRRSLDNAKKDRALQVENAVVSTQTAIDNADSLITDPGLEIASGLQAIIPTIPGTSQADFRSRLEALKSQVFLSQVEKMRGLGALTDREGEALANAIGTMSINQSDDALRKSIVSIRNKLQEARDRLEKSEGLSPSEKGRTIQVDGFRVEFE